MSTRPPGDDMTLLLTRPGLRRVAGLGVALLVATTALVAVLALPANAAPNVFVVTTTADHAADACDSECTLRDAITSANATANASPSEPDEIHFDIPGPPSPSGPTGGSAVDPFVIAPTSALPSILQAVVIDGTTQPYYDFAGEPLIRVDGASAGAASGLDLQGIADDSSILGLQVTRFTGVGIQVQSDLTELSGNYVGTDGTSALGNGLAGIRVLNATTVSIHDNVVSGNQLLPVNCCSDGFGIWVAGSSVSGIRIFANRIGTSANGTADIGNENYGILVNAVGTVTIGGANASERNLVSGNGRGIGVSSPGGVGVRILGNYLGTDLDGTAKLQNDLYGVELNSATGVEVGGADPGEGNLISGNGNVGVIADGGGGHTISGNLIGTNAAGDAALGNTVAGIQLLFTSGNSIGGPGVGQANVISGNGIHASTYGILINGSDTSDNRFEGNLIGVGADGVTPLGNTGRGVSIEAGRNTDNAFVDNTIAHSTGPGIVMGSSGDADANVRNEISGNSIHDNGGLGIDLLPPGPTVFGVTPNDAGDVDVGANALQNFPTLTGATNITGAEGTVINGTLQAAADTTYTLEFFSSPTADPSGNGEGATLLFSGAGVTDGAGTSAIALQAPSLVTPGAVITATATDPLGNTSEFSNAVTVTEDTGPAGFFNETLSVDTATTPAGIDEVDLFSIPVFNLPDATSPTVFAPKGQSPKGQSELGDTPIGLAPKGQSPKGQSPKGQSPKGQSPKGQSPIGDTALGGLPFALVSGLVTTAVGSATLAEFPLARDGGWAAVLDHTSGLVDGTPQGTRLADLFADPFAADGNPSTLPELDPASADPIRLSEIDTTNSPLSRVRLLPLLLGDLSWNDVANADPGGWCAEFAALGFPCDLGETIFGSDLAGFPSWRTTLARRTVGDLNDPARERAVFWAISIVDLNLTGSSLGAIRLDDLPVLGDVVECSLLSGCAAPDLTLADAARASAVTDSADFRDLGATIDDITLGDVAVAFIDPTAIAWEGIPLGQARFENLPEDDPTHFVTYTYAFDVTCDATEGLATLVELASGFRYRDGSATVAVDAASPVDVSDQTTQTPLGVETDLSIVDCSLTPTQDRHVELSFDAMPGFGLGSSEATASAQGGAAISASVSGAEVEVVESFEPNDTPADATLAYSAGLYVGHAGSPGDVDYYTFAAAPGQLIEVNLSHLSDDLDLVLYAPPGAQQDTILRGTSQEISFATEPVIDTGDELGAVLAPIALQDLPYVQNRRVDGISSLRAAEIEEVSTTAVAADSELYTIQVSGYNGSAGPQPYVLTIGVRDAVNLPACPSRTLPAAPATAALPTISAATETLILVNAQRIEQRFGASERADVMAALDTLATHPNVNGVVIRVDADGPIRDAYTALDAEPCSPELANVVVRRINDLVDTLVPDPSGLRNVVLVGDDIGLPHARIRDLTDDGNERGFTGEALYRGESNPLAEAFGRGFYLSDAPYASFTPLTFRGQVVYLPQVAYGRLGESPAAIVGAVNRFVATDGLADPRTTESEPRTALVTDYDFFADGGEEIASSLQAQVGGQNVTHLTGAWSRQQFLDALGGAGDPPDIVGANAHYDPSSLLPGEGNATGDPDQVVDTSDLAGLPSLAARVLFSIGCHFGLGIADDLGLGGSGDPRVYDWAQAYDAKGTAVMIGNTGYGIGDTATIGYDEELLAAFAARLDGSVSIGRSLIRAQRSYFTTLTAYSPYDVKTIEQTILWGLPMYELPPAPAPLAAEAAAPAQRTADAPAAQAVLAPSPALPEDPISGLPSTTRTVSTAPTKVATRDGRAYFRGPQGTVALHGYPIVPRHTLDLPQEPGLIAHGSAPVSLALVQCPTLDLAGTIDAGFAPEGYAFANATLDNASLEPAPASQIVYPTTYQGIGTAFDLAGNPEQQLVIVPAQFRAGPDPRFGSFRCLTGTWLVTYSADTTDFVGPQIDSANAIQTGGDTAFFVEADDPDGVVRVFVQALRQNGTYVRTELVQAADERWSGVHVGADVVEYSIFAFDGNGNSSAANNKGPGYEPLAEPVLPPPTGGGSLTFDPADPDGQASWYVSEPTVSVDGTGYSVSIDGGPPVLDPAEYPVRVRDDGVHLVRSIAPNGDVVGTEVVYIDTTAPEIAFDTPPAGSPYVFQAAIASSFTCTDPLSGTQTCSGPATVDTSVVGDRSFQVDASDRAGNGRTRTVGYRVEYAPAKYPGCSDGRASLPPVAPDGTSSFAKGKKVPLKFRVYDANCVSIGIAGTVVGAAAYVSSSPPRATPSVTASFRFDPGSRQWIANLPTSSLIRGTTYTFAANLADGTRVLFVFRIT